MAAAVELRGDISADEVREAAKASSDASQCRRLLAIATILDGGSRSEAAKIGGVGLQTVRDWVLRFNAEGAAGLIDRKAPGKPPKLDASQQAALAEIVEAGPIPAVHGVVRWRRKDLVQCVREEFGVTMDETTMGRLLVKLGFRHISARPRHHAQDPRLMEAFKKTSPVAWKRSRPSSQTARP